MKTRFTQLIVLLLLLVFVCGGCNLPPKDSTEEVSGTESTPTQTDTNNTQPDAAPSQLASHIYQENSPSETQQDKPEIESTPEGESQTTNGDSQDVTDSPEAELDFSDFE